LSYSYSPSGSFGYKDCFGNQNANSALSDFQKVETDGIAKDNGVYWSARLDERVIPIDAANAAASVTLIVQAEIYYVGDFQNPAESGRRALRRTLEDKYAPDYKRQAIAVKGGSYTVTKQPITYKSDCVEKEGQTKYGFKVSAKFLASDVPSKDDGAKYAVDSRFHITRDLGLKWNELDLHRVDTCDDNNNCNQIYPRASGSSNTKKTKVHYYLDFNSLENYKKFEDKMPQLTVFKGAELEKSESVACNNDLGQIFDEIRQVTADNSGVWSIGVMTVLAFVALLF